MGYPLSWFRWLVSQVVSSGYPKHETYWSKPTMEYAARKKAEKQRIGGLFRRLSYFMKMKLSQKTRTVNRDLSLKSRELLLYLYMYNVEVPYAFKTSRLKFVLPYLYMYNVGLFGKLQCVNHREKERDSYFLSKLSNEGMYKLYWSETLLKPTIQQYVASCIFYDNALLLAAIILKYDSVRSAENLRH